MNQRAVIESWESKRGALIKSSYPTSSYKRINLTNNQLASPILSKKELAIDSLRIPLFNIGDKDRPNFTWSRFLKGPHGGCLKMESGICKEVLLEEGKSLIIGDIVTDKLTLKTGLSLIVATGDISIENLQLEPGAKAEFLSVFDLKLGNIIKSPSSNLFFYSLRGHIKLSSLNDISCLNSPTVRTSSLFPIQLKSTVTKSFGCQGLTLSQFWQDLRYIGDISQKSLN